MFIENLKKLFSQVEDIHHQEPARYYLHEGHRKGINACRQVFHFLKKLNIYNYITREEALPDHPAFRQINDHINKIVVYYPDYEIELTSQILRKLLPQNPLPFRRSVLKSMSLRSAVIYVSDIEMKPVPIPAKVDGYYDFVAPIADNKLHIPLIPEDPDTTATLPPSIHFIDDDNIGGLDPKAILIDSAPKTGRLTQFHAFISLIARSNPVSGLMQLFHDALNSSDLTFATATCILAASEPTIISSVLRIMMRDSVLDHFLRSLCCSVRKAVVGSTSGNLEMAALSNMFVIASEGCWYCTKEVASITQLFFTICNMLKRGVEVPPLAMYILRCALTIAAYEDACGDAAIGMLIELVIQPFVAGTNLENQLANIKKAIISYPESRQRERNTAEATIISVLEQEIIVTPDPENDDEKKDLETVYKFLTKNADPFVRLLLILNSKTYLQSPSVQSIMFAFQKANDIRTLEASY
ncbi:hypothetical protein TRFO_05651 [Tritrichomonas foetus]|uniref:Uncharacterized protein n=1 Tax=Tritrichomonas foetus TaxID=1144522 RepID=A0A1J4K574_9EUKA|nr:hypothetical protein TRFO_05651 [Tritrichomonas foetus]|eukprot:OHT06016.1 hypothetical protein TRFO_05651 [Tritrichomonas foetus]